jgi:peptidylprolyl isomerase
MRIFAGLVLASAMMLFSACGNSAQIDGGGAPIVTATTANAAAPLPAVNDPANTLILELKTGKVTIRLRPDLAPLHVARIKELTRQGFYNGLKWHRVIPGFMAQTGDPRGDGTGGSKLPDVKAEFTPTAFERGTLGAARANDPDSANSQFFICFKHSPFLNGQYTVFGNVVDGMQYVDQIAKGEPPPAPDTIIKMYLASDAK